MSSLATSLSRLSKRAVYVKSRKLGEMGSRSPSLTTQHLKSPFKPSAPVYRSLFQPQRCSYITDAKNSSSAATSTASNDPGPASTVGVFQLGNIAEGDSHSRMLTLIFTCNICQKRSARQFSHHSYTKGVVIIQCPGCDKYHLIADHLGWFQEGKNIEEFMAKKGDSVKKITDVNEITPEIQEFVDEAARERAASMERRKEYIQRREMERAELSQAEAERKAEEAAKFFDETLKPR